MSVAHSLRSVLGLAVFASAASAQGLKVKEEKPGLLAKAKVTAEQALTTAQAAAPKGKLASSEIEQEDGKLVYVFNFTTAGVKGEDEVSVDALTGKLVKTEHESPEDEAKEKAKDKAKEKGAKKKPGTEGR